MSVERRPLHLAFQEPPGVRDTYGGIDGWVSLQAHHPRPPAPSDTLVVFMHPMGIMHYLPLPGALASAGVHVLTAVSRYPNNDSALIMEKVAIDLGRWVAYARGQLGYAKVVLGGWSGGGSLALFYQQQAVRPTVTATPAGDPLDLAAAVLPPADAVLLLAAHVSRAETLTEWLDPSVIDEATGARDPAWHLYSPQCPQPPYAPAFLAEFAARQATRNDRITAWAEATLADLRGRDGPHAERAFVVHGTMACPAWLDPAVDPNERQPGRCYLGDPAAINDAPGGLARFSTLRSWLSQWSRGSSHAGLDCARDVMVPVLVIGNGADDACTPSHTRRLYDAVGSDDRTLHTIAGATHYYAGQAPQLAQAAGLIVSWLRSRGF